MKPRDSARLATSTVVLAVVFVVTAMGSHQGQAADSSKQCGVLAVFGALRAQGVGVNYSDLLKPEYIGSSLGSSLGELVRAVQDHGGHALPLSGLSAEVLRKLECPAVLHVSGRESPGVFQHWLLFLGDDQGQAVISDVGGRVQLCSYSELLARWDGAGLLVSARPIEWRALSRVAAISAGVPILMTMNIVAVSMILAKRLGRGWIEAAAVRSVALKLATVFLGSVLLAVMHHTWAVSGLLQGTAARQIVFLGYRSQNLRRLNLPEFRAAVAGGNHLVIDARLPDSYDHGHVAGALNVPVNADRSSRASLLAQVSKAQPIIVYCQSESCPFDEAVGAALVADGYTDVSLFPPGWASWQSGAAGE